MKITINYSTYPYKVKKILKGVLIGFSLLTIGFLYNGANQIKLNRAESLKYQKSIERLDKEIEAQNSFTNQTAGDDPKKFEKKIALVNELILKKSFSWTEFLNDLEKAIPQNISIKKIEPHFTDYSVNLSGEALTLKDLTRLILSLEESPQFSSIFLLDQKQSKEGRIEFLIHLVYKEKGKNERSS